MQQSTLLSSRALSGAVARPARVIRAQQPRKMVVRASQSPVEGEKTLAERLALPAAAVLGAALLFAATPDVAEAARSGGRVGGSSGFAARRSAPAPAPRSAPPVVNNYYGGGGFGFGMPFFPGFGMGYGFGFPVFGFGIGLSTIFNLMILSIVISVVWNVISNFTNSDGRSSGRNDKDEEW